MTEPSAARTPENLAAGAAAEWWSRLRADGTAETRAAFEAWRAADPAHDQAYLRISRRWEQTAFLAGSAVARSRDLDRLRPFRRHVLMAGSAAAAAVIVLIGIRYSEPRPAVPNSATTVVTADDAPRRVRLSDGSVLTLSPSTRLHVAMASYARTLWLRTGHARFDVAHDAARPFTVSTTLGSVTALGTVFEIALRRGGMQVSLLRGSIEVRDHPTLGEPQRMRLRAGQSLLIPALRSRGTALPAGAATELRSEPMITFMATPLDEAIADFNRRNRSQIILANGIGSADAVTGAFRATDPRSFAGAVGNLFGLKVEPLPDGNLRLIRPR